MVSDVLKILQSHTSVRDYESTPISNDELKEMIHAAQHAASSHFVQAYSVVQMTDQDKIKKLTTFASNERQILSAPVVLLFCADFNRLQQACAKHNIVLDTNNMENLIVATIDTALFAQNFVIAAESRGYGICYIGGVRNNPEQISDLVNLPNYVFPLFGMTVGVPAEAQQVKPRLPVDAILHENSYDKNKHTTYLNTYDETMQTYYKTRSTNKKELSWTKSMAEFLKNPRREHMHDFIRSRGFDI